MLELDGIEFAIDGTKILDGISARFEGGKIHGIIGPNGSGKSTLLKTICRIWEPQSGTISINGRDNRTISRKELSTLVTLVPQNTSIGFPISVFDVVSMGRNPHLQRFEGMRQRDREIIERALRQTGIEPLKERNINELSGGEGQLAIIARAIATEAELILLDEPTSELDVRHTLDIFGILDRFREEGKTILVSIHDLNLARKFCDTISILCRGRLFFSGTPEEAFSEENIRQVFEVNVKEYRVEETTFLEFAR
ncbi:ABC transporter ATP-binding protein [Geomonas sp. RF6]|uniref:ABC transporter ATP-binding protein n=1 Tax=Geomonas sp. RF6 TaxID=2897342 RepID=UPI001E3FA024|nr:ABC transporter ATP-binding protein [Geomonas sp. RF6]UFS70944.1 ABC transporter ATP-binding protein [Geomonas sp. RF6]